MKKISHIFKFLFERKIPFNIAILIVAVIIMATVIQSPGLHEKKPAGTGVTVQCDDKINMTQLREDKMIRPLLIAEVPQQSQILSSLKEEIENNLIQLKKDKKINDISVYFLKLNTGDWIGINNDEKYNSTGYFRLAMLITYLKVGEGDPSVLNKKIWLPPTAANSIKSDSVFVLKGGKNYSVSELLRYMIIYPDTNSKALLTANLNIKEFEKLFDELGLAKPDLAHRKFAIRVSEYSKFLHLLFNSRYLNETDSEYALQLLSEESERKGMLKLLPADIKVIHKFSEKFSNNEYELRESGIIYGKDNSYLLTMFAKGSDNKELELAIGGIAKKIYDYTKSVL